MALDRVYGRINIKYSIHVTFKYDKQTYSNVKHNLLKLPYCNPGQEWLKCTILISCKKQTGPTYTVTRDTGLQYGISQLSKPFLFEARELHVLQVAFVR